LARRLNSKGDGPGTHYIHTDSNGVGTLDTPFVDPDLETLRLKMNELIAALRR